MSYLVDTNVLSGLRQRAGRQPDPALLAWAKQASLAQMYVSTITLHELEVGVQRAERRDSPLGHVLRRWMDDSVLQVFRGRLLGVDRRVATLAASVHVPDPAPQLDALIGATALVHGLTMITRNVRDFERFEGLAVMNPWEWDS